ncbi:hypothetical protein LJC59_06255 [Desulfovibrio sp. OttesenSCG-928-A18]|nr:hypothetical protein [Desulfovibrio sp. OttesenSCG-928-A18]
MADYKKELQDVNDVERVVQSLTPEDWEAIDLAAHHFAGDVAVDPYWLITEALERILDGRRKWPPRNPVSFRAFFCGVMKSIRSEVCSGVVEGVTHYYSQIQDSIKTPVEQLEQQEREAWAKQVIESTLDYFSDDEIVMAILIAKSDGQSGEEIRNQEGITRKQYDAALKRLSRYRNINLKEGEQK